MVRGFGNSRDLFAMSTASMGLCPYEQRGNIVRRIYVSLLADPWLPENLNRHKCGIVEEIGKLGYAIEIFTNPRGKPGLASAGSWHPPGRGQDRSPVHGVAVLGMPRWRFTDSQGKEVLLPTSFNHYEGALFHTLRLRTLVLAQRYVLPCVVFDRSFGGYVGKFEAESDVAGLHTENFRVPFGHRSGLLDERRDVFLGYSSASEETAAAIKRYLLSFGAKVLDWQTDFIPGPTILDQTEQAATRSVGGIFLFTKDDELADHGHAELAAPCDNVVFGGGLLHRLERKAERVNYPRIRLQDARGPRRGQSMNPWWPKTL
jgi:Predicted nucleotide-binding protein containing TIR-like domain